MLPNSFNAILLSGFAAKISFTKRNLSWLLPDDDSLAPACLVGTFRLFAWLPGELLFVSLRSPWTPKNEKGIYRSIITVKCVVEKMRKTWIKYSRPICMGVYNGEPLSIGEICIKS